MPSFVAGYKIAKKGQKLQRELWNVSRFLDGSSTMPHEKVALCSHGDGKTYEGMSRQ